MFYAASIFEITLTWGMAIAPLFQWILQTFLPYHQFVLDACAASWHMYDHSQQRLLSWFVSYPRTFLLLRFILCYVVTTFSFTQDVLQRGCKLKRLIQHVDIFCFLHQNTQNNKVSKINRKIFNSKKK